QFYIDPTNSYEFRSLKEVHHYLESQDTNDRVVTPNKRKIEDLQVSGNQTQHSGRTSSEPKGVSKGRLAELKLQTAREKDQPLKHESAREEANVEPKGKKAKTEPVKQIAAPVRWSPRLTALKRDQEANDVHALVGATDTNDQLQPAKQVKNPKSKALSSSVIQNKDGAHAPSTSGNAEDKYPSAPEQILGASAACSLTDVGRQNAHAPPQQNGLVGTADAMPGYSLSSLFRSIWSDPCLEFAFRTLTGDIPVLDNNLAVANYFLPPQDSNKGTVPPNCPSSTYDGARKNHGQVDRVRLPMPMPKPSDKLYSSGWFPPQ
uniref:MBD domain-containing protein n=1 Tax=Aegilops tauschii subsp. strangulata TaxID=200361 RepID=A0A453CR21_AEGTS